MTASSTGEESAELVLSHGGITGQMYTVATSDDPPTGGIILEDDVIAPGSKWDTRAAS